VASARDETIEQLEDQGYDTRNLECLDKHRDRRAARSEPPASEAELAEYRTLLPTLRWLHENREQIERAILYQLPVIVAGCPMAGRLLGGE